jgi:hypothetical protein
VKVNASKDIIKSVTGQGKIIPGHCDTHIVTIDMTKVSLDMLSFPGNGNIIPGHCVTPIVTIDMTHISLDMLTISLEMVTLLDMSHVIGGHIWET